MKFISGECTTVKRYLNWVYGISMKTLTLDQFELWWRGLSDEERAIEWSKAIVHPDFD